MKPEDLTDDIIHEHMNWLERQPYIGANQRFRIREGIADCSTALGRDGLSDCLGRSVTPTDISNARQRICDAINARAGDRAIQRLAREHGRRAVDEHEPHDGCTHACMDRIRHDAEQEVYDAARRANARGSR